MPKSSAQKGHGEKCDCGMCLMNKPMHQLPRAFMHGVFVGMTVALLAALVFVLVLSKMYQDAMDSQSASMMSRAVAPKVIMNKGKLPVAPVASPVLKK